jgi:hypothetical protein
MPHYTSGGKATAARLQKDLGDAVVIMLKHYGKNKLKKII